jgi:hypothetical protein
VAQKVIHAVELGWLCDRPRHRTNSLSGFDAYGLKDAILRHDQKVNSERVYFPGPKQHSGLQDAHGGFQPGNGLNTKGLGDARDVNRPSLERFYAPIFLPHRFEFSLLLDRRQ